MPVNHYSFEKLIAPYSEAVFFDKYWDKTSLLIDRQDSGYFEDLLTEESLDNILTSIRLPLNNIDMAQDSAPFDKMAFCSDTGVDIAKIFSLHSKGATIILRALQQWSAELQSLCKGLEQRLKAPCQTNVYLTPPNNQSTPPHWDTHDLFILQVKGSKLWKLYESDYVHPLDHQRFDTNTYSIGSNTEDVQLDAGDMLYLPRGAIHAPVSIDYSIHIALGVHVTRWVDVMAYILTDTAMKHSEFRGSATNGAIDADAIENIANVLQKKLTKSMSPDQIVRALAAMGGDNDKSYSIDRRGQFTDFSRTGGIGPVVLTS